MWLSREHTVLPQQGTAIDVTDKKKEDAFNNACYCYVFKVIFDALARANLTITC